MRALRMPGPPSTAGARSGALAPRRRRNHRGLWRSHNLRWSRHLTVGCCSARSCTSSGRRLTTGADEDHSSRRVRRTAASPRWSASRSARRRRYRSRYCFR